MMYTQAMKGSLQIALDYANKLIEVTQNKDGCELDESRLQACKEREEFLRQERGVIYRLMGNYKEALTDFHHILAIREDYECLIQMSYLKDLMEDKSGALDYARRAKKVQGDADLDRPGRGAFCLGFKALPDEYRHWLLNVDEGSWASSSSVWGSISVQLPKEVCSENAKTALPATQQAELPSCPTDRTEDDNVKLGVNILLELEPVLIAWENGLNT